MEFATKKTTTGQRPFGAPELQPYSWYHNFVIYGARQHRLPVSYIRSLSRFNTIVDSDSERHATNLRLICSDGNS
ncbi:MAG: hypothetical protein RIK87_14415 [Fuerstiella sp.]